MSGLLRYLRDVYSLDTLDARFSAEQRKPQQPSGGHDGSGQKPLDAIPAIKTFTTQPSRWKTPEFFLYYLALIVAPILMTKAVVDVSRESNPNYPKFSHLLSPGWIPGRKVDNSDSQYASFRDNIPYMTIVVIAHPLLRRLYNYWRGQDHSGNPTSSKASLGTDADRALTPDDRLQQRVSFDLAFAALFVTALHGISAIKVFAILYINFKIATQVRQTYVPVASWVFCIGILFANELCHGYPLARIATLLLPTQTTAAGGTGQHDWAVWLDSVGGLVPHWEILFNITVLRLLSFNLDYYWTSNRGPSSPVEVSGSFPLGALYRSTDAHKKKQLDPANLTERDRLSFGARASDYTFRNYLAYALYSPLYLAGPIVTFNDYISQNRFPLPTIDKSRIIKYAVRFLVVVLTMEVVLHFIYAVAICRAQPTWRVYTPFQLSMLGYFNLHIIWLKLLIPWRFFRLWSLIDGIDPPENMVRCMSDNYSALAFWRGWHRSYNRWLLRYIYIPLGGGSKGPVRGILNFLAVFTFVALWHDINLRLLMWGWMVVFFVLPEVTCSLLFPARKWTDRPESYRMLCGVGAVCNILMMMAANLVGFAVGLDGLKGLLDGIVGSWDGVAFLVSACGALFVGAQTMFEVRESEKRKGIVMKC